MDLNALFESKLFENSLKEFGYSGDFMIYRKQGDKEYPIRISYLQEKDGKCLLKKHQIKESKDGLFSLLGTSGQSALFLSVSELVDGSGESVQGQLKTPFLGLHKI